MRSSKLLIIALAVAISPVIAHADQVINFAGFSDLTVLTTQDFGDGITFSGAEILTCCDNNGGGSLNPDFPPVGGDVKGANVAFNPTGPMTLQFTTPSDFFEGFFTYNNGLTVTVYNGSNTVIDTVNGACGASGSGGDNAVGSGCGSPDEKVLINDPGMISKIVITGGSGDNFTIDDISFTGSVNVGAVPEPTPVPTVLLGGVALVAIARRFRAFN